ncbi:MAG: GNAT family N-acetyltransferase [Bacillota bacterium]
MKSILETERLILREMTEADYGALAAILQDEQTMYAYEGAFTDAEVREWLQKQLVRYREDGFGLWAVALKTTREMIGQAGVTWQQAEDARVPEIGYLFNRAYWHKGYAAEAAAACKRYAFDVLGFLEIYSIIRDTNIASVNVAIRNGMLLRGRFIKHYRGIEMPHFVFSARKDDPRGL